MTDAKDQPNKLLSGNLNPPETLPSHESISSPTAQAVAETTKVENETPELKTVHSSPPPRDAPVIQPDDISTDTREREKLLEQATLFLETGSVRDAPIDKKREFLKSKGLTDAEAVSLTKQLNTTTPTQNGIVAQKASTTPRPVLQQSPPIVTYPEFLSPPPPAGPKPLITGTTLLKSLYFGAATAATVYGANKLIVAPMLDALTTARLEFASTVSKNLDEFNSRLQELMPEEYIRKQSIVYASADDESDTSDPSELFHVDAQTQTSDVIDADDDGSMTPDGKLEELTVQMKTLVESHSDGTDNELNFLLEDLTSYLEGLTYDSGLSASMYTSPFGGYSGQVGGMGKEKDKEDPIMKVKQEIRSVKGVLLHTKNFPASR
ncbi:peroxisomal membrane anchor protein conserved region-domain-containing protein [Geopyxis carbonaria]|nr:peroxisomal membrane anchor protein conserved region-domain-containing protein [Geopyxis carbonaria]